MDGKCYLIMSGRGRMITRPPTAFEERDRAERERFFSLGGSEVGWMM